MTKRIEATLTEPKEFASWKTPQPKRPGIKPMFFVIPIKAKAKERPRFSRAGHAYTPSTTRAYERDLKHIMYRDMQQAGWQMTHEPICVHMNFVFEKAKTSVLEYPSQDIDNLVKSTLDAMQSVVFPNDKQVISIYASKEFGIRDQIEISVCSVQDDY